MKTELTKLTIVALILLGIIVTGCGKKDSPSAPAPITWTEAQQDDFMASCLQDVHDTNPTLQVAPAKQYCSCMGVAISKRWTYEDYASNQQAYVQKLVDDGTAKTCVSNAGL